MNIYSFGLVVILLPPHPHISATFGFDCKSFLFGQWEPNIFRSELPSSPMSCCSFTTFWFMGNKDHFFVSFHIKLSLLLFFQGSKAMDYSNGLFDCQSPTSPFLGGLRVLHLLEDLRGALELMDNEERDNLRCQIPDSTAEGLAEWLHGRLVKSACVWSWSFRSCLISCCGWFHPVGVLRHFQSNLLEWLDGGAVICLPLIDSSSPM